MKPAELARKAADVIRAFHPAPTTGVVMSWSYCMLDAVLRAAGFADSSSVIVVVDAIGRIAPKRPHDWSYHPERIRADVTRAFERVAITFEAQR